jgi:hypothetical protein
VPLSHEVEFQSAGFPLAKLGFCVKGFLLIVVTKSRLHSLALDFPK